MTLDNENQRNLLIQLLESMVPGGRNLKEVEQGTARIRSLIDSIKNAKVENKQKE